MKKIKEAKDFIEKNMEDGCKCPVCDQHVQMYNYPLYDSSAVALIKLYRLTRTSQETKNPREYFHARDFAYGNNGRGRSTHYNELRHWGLIEKAPSNKDPKIKSSGMWKITPTGRLFVNNRISVPSRILVYNGDFIGFSGDAGQVRIKEALGNKFNYSELMGFK